MTAQANQALIEKFYSSFAKKEVNNMLSCYHEQITFSDPVFKGLQGEQARNMWRMLLARSTDLVLVFSQVQANEHTGSAYWEATYTFSQTGRQVTNKIKAHVEFKDGKIYQHTDHFDLWAWSKMALGLPGYLLGWTPFLQQKIRSQAMNSLEKYSLKNTK